MTLLHRLIVGADALMLRRRVRLGELIVLHERSSTSVLTTDAPRSGEGVTHRASRAAVWKCFAASIAVAASLLALAGCGADGGGGATTPALAPTPAPPPAPLPPPPMTVSGTVRTIGASASGVAGAVVRATNLDTGAVDGEATTDMNGTYAVEGLPGNRYSIEVAPPSGYLAAAPIHVARPESGDPEVSADFSLIFYPPVEGTVTTMPASELILMPANPFDLEGRTLTFSPDSAGRYTVTDGSLGWEEPGPATATYRLNGEGLEHVAVDLPFSFSFGHRTWVRVYANANGNISFQRPERENWPQRDPWSDATMRSVAAAIDARAAAGLETMIAVLWGINGEIMLSVDSTPARVVLTWRGSRPTPRYAHHAPLGENLFQARLYPSGVVEFAYQAIAEQDGFVGLFHGGSARGPTLDAADDAVGDVGERVLDLTSVELVDNGSTVLARMTLAADIPEHVPDGEIDYRVFLHFGNYDCDLGLAVTADGRRPFSGGCGPVPSGLGYRVRGATIEMWFSKTRLHGVDRFAWDADAAWWGRDFDQIFEGRTARVGPADRDLGALGGTAGGNLFEVFHYPVFPKAMHHVTSYIYQRAPDIDEIAVLFTDFRIDDLYGHGPGSGTINEAVRGIGPGPADPIPGSVYGSGSLLVTMSPLFLGGANFWTETGVSEGLTYRNFAQGIWWIAHEATHRWVAELKMRNPRTGRIEDLRDDGAHWSERLHARAVFPVWPGFASAAYAGPSVNGGAIWADNGDGTFTRSENHDYSSGPLATGLSALDLYAMGMIPPDEVPDTFILRPAEGARPEGTVRATKVPVRIEDIIAAMGPRLPAADASRKEFRLGVYLLHDGRAPRPDFVQKARDVSAAVAEYFFRATDGRMLVIPNPGSE